MFPILLRLLANAISGGEESYVVRGAKLKCTMGTDEGILNLPVSSGVYIKDKPVMSIADSMPHDNISVFGFCKAPGNEEQACEPLTCARWTNGKQDLFIIGELALTSKSKLECAKGGTILIEHDGQD
jgi:hypothetical protein